MRNYSILSLVFALFLFGTAYSYADNMMTGDNMKIYLSSPLKQIKSGIAINDVKCSNGFSLVFKSLDNFPACVRPSSAKALVAIGWAKDNTMVGMADKGTEMKNVLTDNTTSPKVKDYKMMTGSNPVPMQKDQFRKSAGLVGITDYINTTPEKLAQDQKGKVILYDFWTFNCINCIHTLPHIVSLNAKYADKGLLVIGIHSPETIFEKDPSNVRDAVQKYGIKYPVVLDTNFETWNAFGNVYWPREYIVDSDGYIRYDHIGEGGYDDTEHEIQSLLAEKG